MVSSLQVDDVIDPDDQVELADGSWIGERGVVKMMFAALHHNPPGEGRENAKASCELVLRAARAAGYAKSDLISLLLNRDEHEGRFADELARALEDGRIDSTEAERLRRWALAAVVSLVDLVARIEAMADD
ncbi:MAG: hypothetical protein KDH20_18945 [Rhodocyclaceae bacterium]|nr:hypothetical protein [Rhodocyclaceae bacterium]